MLGSYDLYSIPQFLKHKSNLSNTNQIKSEFSLKMSIDQCFKIIHISQTVHQNKLQFYREILDT
jgi:hypothetical protein